jgi:hypothetical protein
MAIGDSMSKPRSTKRKGHGGDEPKQSQQERIKITLGEYQLAALGMAAQYSMSGGQFCAYCVKFFVEHYEGKPLPPLKRAMPSLDR